LRRKVNTEPQIIALVLIAGIGDLIMASKAIRAVRNGHPQAEIHLVTSTEAAPLAGNYPYVDRVWAFPIRDMRKGEIPVLGIWRLVRNLRKVPFYRVVNLYRIASRSGALKTGLLFLLMRAQEKIGHGNRGFGLFLDRKAPPEIYLNRHFVDAMTDIAELAGGIPDGGGIEVFWEKGSEEKWREVFRRPDGSRVLRVGINPGADRPKKRWSPRKYAVVANRLSEQVDAEIFLLGGPGEEGLAEEIRKNLKEDFINLAGRMTINDLVYVISRLDLLVTNDSGPMHIAAALGVPTVAIFGPEDPVYTRPYTSPDLYRVVHVPVDCRPCVRKRCERPLCLDLIQPDQVLDKCLELLKPRPTCNRTHMRTALDFRPK
jgi:lipopolysaccharide heptosyltransferase II